MSSLTAEEFARALQADVGEDVKKMTGEIFFNAATRVYEHIVGRTPVDTGYLRASLSATLEGQSPPDIGPRDPNVKYRANKNAPRADSARALTSVLASPAPIEIGFTAEYAQYVEDDVGMVKSAEAAWPGIVENAARDLAGDAAVNRVLGRPPAPGADA